MMKMENPDEIMLNPEYLKKLEDEKGKEQKIDLTDEEKAHFEGAFPYQTNTDSPIVQGIVEFLTNPIDPKAQNKYILKDETEFEEPDINTSIFVPLFTTTF